MSEVRFDGVLEMFGGDLCSCSPEIAGRNIVSELRAAFPGRPVVKVTLGVEPIKTGPLWTAYGFGGTDVTPPDSPEIEIGGWDLVDHLHELDGREVVLIVETVDA